MYVVFWYEWIVFVWISGHKLGLLPNTTTSHTKTHSVDDSFTPSAYLLGGKGVIIQAKIIRGLRKWFVMFFFILKINLCTHEPIFTPAKYVADMSVRIAL